MEENITDLSVKEVFQVGYQALRERRLAYDSMMWQSPLLGITAQSFLLSIAFNSSNGTTACLVCALVSIILGCCAIQLMMKHRHHERITTQQLEELEKTHGLYPVHQHLRKASDDDGTFYVLINLSSYKVWIAGLITTTAAGVIASIVTVISCGISCNL